MLQVMCFNQYYGELGVRSLAEREYVTSCITMVTSTPGNFLSILDFDADVHLTRLVYYEDVHLTRLVYFADVHLTRLVDFAAVHLTRLVYLWKY